LANIYLDLLDRNFRRHVERGALCGRLVRYADDLVLLTPQEPGREMSWMDALLGRLGLTLSPNKTRVLDARQERFDFLGHRHRWQGGRLHLDLAPKSKRRIHDELREKTRHTWKQFDELIVELNQYIRGARQYYRRIRRRTLERLDRFVGARLARWWANKHGRPWPAWSLMQGDALWRQHGLERWNLPPALRPLDSRRAR
jgi:hypothetical protein